MKGNLWSRSTNSVRFDQASYGKALWKTYDCKQEEFVTFYRNSLYVFCRTSFTLTWSNGKYMKLQVAIVESFSLENNIVLHKCLMSTYLSVWWWKSNTFSDDLDAPASSFSLVYLCWSEQSCHMSENTLNTVLYYIGWSVHI